MSGTFIKRILFVDLSTGAMRDEELGEEDSRRFIGNKGLGAKLLYECTKPNVDPLGPDNVLVYALGPLTGTGIPGASRYEIVTKSPLTHTLGDSSSGGSFGHEMRRAGFDAICFSGASPKPVYLLLVDGKASLRDASHLWGMKTNETEEAIRRELGDGSVKVSCIGPAGENQSCLAGVFHEGCAAGRAGLGAVMGSKHLKALATKGSHTVGVSDKEKFNFLRKELVNRLTISDEMLPLVEQVHLGKEVKSDVPRHELEVGLFLYRFKNWGTCAFLKSFVVSGEAPVKNWLWVEDQETLKLDGMTANGVTRYLSKKYTCVGCPIACKGFLTIPGGTYAVNNAAKPEYESLAMLGPNCLISGDNVEAVIYMNHLCNAYGMDTISAGCLIGFAMEAYERGAITKKDTGGLDLSWGNVESAISLIEGMGKGEGFGAVLTDGVKKAAEAIGQGSDEYAIHIGGQELPAHDPRTFGAWGTAYIVDATPARHTTAHEMWLAEQGKRMSPYDELYYPDALTDDVFHKGQIYADTHSWHNFCASAGLCSFVSCLQPGYRVIEFVEAVTGWKYTVQEALETGRRIEALRKAFNVREGIKQSDSAIPRRVYEAPLGGPLKGRSLDLNTAARNYYEAMGFAPENGAPLDRTLEELGINEILRQTSK
jgi:aldehyde:ferredoxin oxidoreductase